MERQKNKVLSSTACLKVGTEKERKGEDSQLPYINEGLYCNP